MKHLAVTILAGALSACATSSAYGPQNGDDTGFTSQRIEQDRFRVSYTAANEAQARDLALLRAAEVTLDNGFDWFRVIGGNTSGDPDARRRNAPRIGVGVGVGSGGYYRNRNRTRTNVSVGVGDIVGLVKGPRVTSAIEIRTGQGEKPTSPDAYDARSVAQNLRPATFK